VERIRDLDHLEDLLSEPTPGAVEAMRRLEGDVLVLGVGGKMGPSLARMVRRASDAAGVRRRVLGVSRFSTPTLARQLNDWGVETIACDLLDPEQLDKLPEAPNVISMTGVKFGTAGQQARTWATNCYLAGAVSRKFRGSRIVAFSTGNVYPLTPVALGGSVETDEPQPLGEYAQSALGRERLFEHFSRTEGTRMALLRLNYAVEMRYGVLADLAGRVWRGEEIDLAMGNLNCIWQADASAVALRAFDDVSSPPLVLNVTGPETLSVRRLGEQFGRLMDRPARFVGAEAGSALLSNAGLMLKRYGYPRVPPQRLIEWTADWVMRGGPGFGKPTHFETRDGKF
jgi:dTDP-4-dehydrorhamnose reductase